MGQENATLQLPRDLIESAIRDQVTIAMAAAFANKEDLIGKCVTEILSHKVDYKGNPNTSGYEIGTPYLQWALRDCLKKAVLEALVAQMAENTEVIKQSIAKQLQSSKSPLVKSLAESLVSGLASAVALNYRFTLEVKGDV